MAEYRGFHIEVNPKIDGLDVCAVLGGDVRHRCCTFKEAMKWVDDQHLQAVRKDPDLAEMCDIRNELYVLSDRLTKIIQEKTHG